MSNLIDRQAAIDAINALHDKPNAWLDCAVDAVIALPTEQPDKDLIHLQKEQAYLQGYADGRKQRKGKWIDSGYGVECSLCGEWYPHASIARNQLNFCPNCGTDMRPQFEEPEINPCRGCEDYDGKGGCKTKGGCGDRRGDSDE